MGGARIGLGTLCSLGSPHKGLWFSLLWTPGPWGLAHGTACYGSGDAVGPCAMKPGGRRKQVSRAAGTVEGMRPLCNHEHPCRTAEEWAAKGVRFPGHFTTQILYYTMPKAPPYALSPAERQRIADLVEQLSTRGVPNTALTPVIQWYTRRNREALQQTVQQALWRLFVAAVGPPPRSLAEEEGLRAEHQVAVDSLALLCGAPIQYGTFDFEGSEAVDGKATGTHDDAPQNKERQTFAGFLKWFLANYPSGIRIGDPAWHAPLIYRQISGPVEGGEPRAKKGDIVRGWWDGMPHRCKITKRAYNPDTGKWEYDCTNPDSASGLGHWTGIDENADMAVLESAEEQG